MKRGYVREDGKVFARKARGKELWLTKEQYEKRELKRKAYVKKCQELYKKHRKEQRSFGDYDHKKNLYFIGISTSGKEIWRSKYFLEKRKIINNKNKKKYVNKCHELPKTSLKLFDQHPENPNLYVIHKLGNKIFFGNKKRMEEKKEKLRIIYIKRYLKAKKIRQFKLDNIANRIKRGTKHPTENLIFFEYNRVGKEIWLDPNKFKEKRDKECQKRRQIRLNKKLRENSNEH